ncbi:MAG: helix-turn-helix transcriptional regulator [Gemmatimonadales bacterium]
MPVSPWTERFWRSSRGRIVARLRRGPAAVDELAGLLGLTENGVRAHLATLERDGWIRAEGVRRPKGPGKPALLYVLAPETESLLSSAYRPVLIALLAVLAERERRPRLDALLREAGARLGRDLAAEGGTAGGAAGRAVRLLTLLGGSVEADSGRDRTTIRAAGCPVGEAVSVSPSVCHAVSALLEGALGLPVRDVCDRSGRPSCRFEIDHGRKAPVPRRRAS